MKTMNKPQSRSERLSSLKADPGLAYFMERELQRLPALRKGLLGPYQREYARPWRTLLRLKGRNVVDALNPYTRADWFRALATTLADVVSARSPKWRARRELFLVTLVDSRWSLAEDEGVLDQAPLQDIRRGAVSLLRDVDFVGMIDIALYVSTNRLWSVPRRAFAHCHLICWGTTLAELKERCRKFSEHRRGIISGSTPGHVTLANPSDLLQVVWYVSKAPRNQYQIQRKPEGGAIQRQRALAYVNHVRLLKLLDGLDIGSFVIASGEGKRVSDRAMQLMTKWGHKAVLR